MMSSLEILKLIPIDRILPGTDHPYGDRFSYDTKRPGGVDEVEKRRGELLGRDPRDIRIQFWKNLRSLIEDVQVQKFFTSQWQATFRNLD